MNKVREHLTASRGCPHEHYSIHVETTPACQDGCDRGEEHAPYSYRQAVCLACGATGHYEEGSKAAQRKERVNNWNNK